MDIDEIIKNKNTIPYRQGAIGLILNQDNQVLISKNIDYKENEWRFPGGGIDKGEEPKDTLLRELREELGSDKFEIIAQSKYKTHYDWSDEDIKRHYEKRGELYRGQEQFQFLVRFTGLLSDIKPDPNELRQIKWISLDELPEYSVFPDQWETIKKVLDELVTPLIKP